MYESIQHYLQGSDSMEAGSRGDSLGSQPGGVAECMVTHSDSISPPTAAPTPPPTSSRHTPPHHTSPAWDRPDPPAGTLQQPLTSAEQVAKFAADHPLDQSAQKVQIWQIFEPCCRCLNLSACCDWFRLKFHCSTSNVQDQMQEAKDEMGAFPGH